MGIRTLESEWMLGEPTRAKSACSSALIVSAGWVSRAAAWPASTDAANDAATSLRLKNLESSRSACFTSGARPKKPKVQPASRAAVAAKPRKNAPKPPWLANPRTC